MTFEELMDLLWRWKYGALPVVTISDVRAAVITYGASLVESTQGEPNKSTE